MIFFYGCSFWSLVEFFIYWKLAAVLVYQSTEKHAAGYNIAPEPIDDPTNDADIHVDEPRFSSGKLPLQGSHKADEKKALGAGGLAQGTPKVGVFT